MSMDRFREPDAPLHVGRGGDDPDGVIDDGCPSMGTTNTIPPLRECPSCKCWHGGGMDLCLTCEMDSAVLDWLNSCQADHSGNQN